MPFYAFSVNDRLMRKSIIMRCHIKKIKKNVRNLYLRGLMPLLYLLSPCGRAEKIILYISLAYYLSIWAVFVFLLDNRLGLNIMGYDTMYNIDVYTFPYIHCWHLRHPLFALFNIIQDTICWVIGLWGLNYKLFIHTIITPILFAFSNLLLYKIIVLYNKDSKYIAYLLVCLFSSFAHVILLAGQYETFPFSLLFLLLILLYLHKPQTIWQENILFAALTGVTSTHCLKFIFLWIWDNSIMYTIRRCFKSAYLFCLLMILPTLQLILSSLKHGDFWGHFITNATGFTYLEYSTYNSLKDNFFSEPLFFHNVNAVIYDPRVYMNSDNIMHATSNMDAYPHAIIPVCIIFIYFFSILGVLLNIKTKIVKVMLSFFTVDLFFLLVLGYGKNEAHLFCLHWIYILPISIGLFLGKFRYAKIKYLCTSLIVMITFVALCYNTVVYVTSFTNPLHI